MCVSVCAQMPKCMSCHKAILVITGRAHCMYVYIYIYIYIGLVVTSMQLHVLASTHAYFC